MSNKQTIALGVGVALFCYLIYETGPASLAANLELIGPKLVLIVALERIVDLFNTVGWSFTFSRSRRISVAELSALYTWCGWPGLHWTR
jgi:hypothetical protein